MNDWRGFCLGRVLFLLSALSFFCVIFASIQREVYIEERWILIRKACADMSSYWPVKRNATVCRCTLAVSWTEPGLVLFFHTFEAPIGPTGQEVKTTTTRTIEKKMEAENEAAAGKKDFFTRQ